MTKTLMSAASAVAILLGSSAVYAQTQDQTGAATGQTLGAQQQQDQLGMQQPGMGMDREYRATVESYDEEEREIVLRLRAGEQVDFGEFDEGDEVYVSFEDEERVGRIGREPGMEWDHDQQQQNRGFGLPAESR